MFSSKAQRRGWFVCSGLVVALLSGSHASRADWVNFVDDTANRLVSASNLGSGDVREKDYAWGDVDKDGDTDLVVVRKQPWTTSGKDPNVLFMNEGGVLRDRTSLYAFDSDVVGDSGFLTPTNDRSVRLVDLDNDTWIDIVTSTTISVGDPKYIGHPRIYRNKGNDGGGNWLGFKYEASRVPTMLTYNGQSGFNPCFCSVSAGDLNGDGYLDLYFGDYDAATGGTTCATNDFNDRLLINRGAAQPGYFDDVTIAHFSGTVPSPVNTPFHNSHFGNANVLVDLNGDGLTDIVKQSSLDAPLWVGTAYNNAGSMSFFDDYDVNYGTGSPYFVSAGDLNNDNRLDLVITDDGADRYLLNQGNGGDGMANFVSFTFSFNQSADDGFGEDSLIVDLNNDGFKDVLIADVDVDQSGCTRRMHIYHNLGGAVGANVVMKEDTSGGTCQNFQGNPPSCIVASIPSDKLEGVHDVAVFDINGDGWQDMVVGRCTGTQVYMNVPPGNPVGSVPNGDGISGDMLTANRSGSQITLSWGESCILNDTDYSIYEGRIGLWGQHYQKFCTTAGSTTQTFTPPATESTYYLIVPHNGVVEGSYGVTSASVQRPVSLSACRPQNLGTCD